MLNTSHLAVLQPLIVPSAALDACMFVYYGVTCIWWCLASSRMRAVIALSTIFTFGLRIELGFALDAFRCVSILATGSLLWNGFSRRGRSFTARILFGWAPFVLYALLITMYGTTLISSDLAGYNGSSFRGSAVRPYINLFTRLTIIPMAWTIFCGLKSRDDIRFFIKGWYYCAVGSAAIGLIQLVTFLAGHPLFGILREEGNMPVLPFAGINWLRVCAFTGEPKHMGDIMFVTLILHLTFGRKLGLEKENRILASILPGVLFSLVFSASSGAMIAVVIYFLTLGFFTPGRARIMSTAFTSILLLVCTTETFQEVYHLRFERLEELYDHSQTLATDASASDRIKDDKEKASLAYAIQNPSSLFFGQGVGVSPYLYNHLVSRRYRGKYNEPNNGLMLCLQAVGVIGLGILLVGMKRLLYGDYLPPGLRWEGQLFCASVLLMLAIHQHFLILSPVLGLMSATGWRQISEADRSARAPDRTSNLRPRLTERAAA